MIKAVIFDLDGTLLNTLNALSFCISKTTRWTRGSVKALPMSRN